MARSTNSLFVTEEQIVRRLGVTRAEWRAASREFEKHQRASLPFPQRDPLFGNRRFWPGVLKYLLVRYGVELRGGAQPADVTWEENFDASIPSTRKASRATGSRPQLAKAF